MEQHHGFEFVPGGGEFELQSPHYVLARTQTIVRCTQGISHTQMNTALCACGVSWKVSSRTGRGYNQTGGYGSAYMGTVTGTYPLPSRLLSEWDPYTLSMVTVPGAEK
jgi:hypothetical protein